VAKDAYLGQIFTSATTVKNGLFYFLKQWSSDNTGFCEDGGVCSVIGKYSVGKNEAISYCSSHLNSIHHPHFLMASSQEDMLYSVPHFQGKMVPVQLLDAKTCEVKSVVSIPFANDTTVVPHVIGANIIRGNDEQIFVLVQQFNTTYLVHVFPKNKTYNLKTIEQMRVLPNYIPLLLFKDQLMTIRNDNEIIFIDPSTGKIKTISKIILPTSWPSWFDGVPIEATADESKGVLYVKYIAEESPSGAFFNTITTVNIATGRTSASPNIKLYETSQTPGNTFSTGVYSN